MGLDGKPISPMDHVALGTMSLKTALVPFRLKSEISWRGYYSNIAHTLLLFTGLVDM